MFKKRFTETVLAVSLAMSAGAAQAAQIAVNGDFETGDFSGWTQFENTGVQTIVSQNGPSLPGNSAAELSVNGTTSLKNANLAAGLLTNGQQVDVSFDARTTASNGGQLNLLLFSEFSGGGANLVLNQVLFPASDWETFNFTAFMSAIGDVGGGFTVEFNPVCGAGGCTPNHVIEVDNLQVNASVVPVPAAVWLFGSGLLGLVGIARKKKAA